MHCAIRHSGASLLQHARKANYNFSRKNKLHVSSLKQIGTRRKLVLVVIRHLPNWRILDGSRTKTPKPFWHKGTVALDAKPGPQLRGGKRGQRLPEQKFRLPKMFSMLTQTPLFLVAVSRWWLFL